MLDLDPIRRARTLESALKIRKGAQATEVSTLLLLNHWTLDTIPAEDVALAAKADAAWNTWSALWRGIELGITRFCADAEPARDQLLGLAGRGLHANARANGRCAQAVRQRLWEMWQSGSKP